MGQKIHPYGLRLGIVTDWKSRWYSEKDYAFQVNQDHQIRKYLVGELRRGALSRIDIERIGTNKVQVDVHTGRPGVVIGRGGSEAERLRSGLEKLTDRIVKFNVIADGRFDYQRIRWSQTDEDAEAALEAGDGVQEPHPRPYGAIREKRFGDDES